MCAENLYNARQVKEVAKMPNKKKLFIMLQSAAIAFMLLFIFFFFAYFLPVQNEHAKIAKLPSHDLTLFVDGNGNFADNDLHGNITYNGQVCRTKEDFSEVLDHDTFAGSAGFSYFYDADHNLYLMLGMDTLFMNGDGRAFYYIEEYPAFHMYFNTQADPLIRALGLGPLYTWRHELQSRLAETIAESRYWFSYRYSRGHVEVSVLSASLQLAFAFALYLIPMIICLFWRNKKTILCVAGIYVLLGAINTVYYLGHYPWLFR